MEQFTIQRLQGVKPLSYSVGGDLLAARLKQSVLRERFTVGGDLLVPHLRQTASRLALIVDEIVELDAIFRNPPSRDRIYVTLKGSDATLWVVEFEKNDVVDFKWFDRDQNAWVRVAVAPRAFSRKRYSTRSLIACCREVVDMMRVPDLIELDTLCVA